MGGHGTIIPAQMSLSVRPGSLQIECAFFYNNKQLFRKSAPLPDHELLKAYRNDIKLAGIGDTHTGSHVRQMRRELKNIMPRQEAAFFRKAVVPGPGASTLALEIELNDPEILDPYPWELLSEKGLLVDPQIPVVVWRSVSAPKFNRLPSSAVLLVGSASLDTTSTGGDGEIKALAKLLQDGTGIHPDKNPSITFEQFRNRLKALEPSVIHIVVHGDIDGFQFQEDPDVSRTHADILAQEIADRVAKSPTANLVLLNACHSASSSGEQASMARRIATMARVTAIGMSAEIPNSVGFDFSKDYFHALISGDSLIEAFGTAAHAIRRDKQFATLWSTPVMYAPPDSNVILFPADPMGQTRLRFQELGRQLRQLDHEIAALTGYDMPQAPDGTSGVGALKVRVAYIRDLLGELDASALPGPGRLRPQFLLTQAQRHSDRALGQLQAMLENLRDPHRSREQRTTLVRSIRLTLNEQIQTFSRLGNEFADTR